MRDIFVQGPLGRVHCRVTGEGPLLLLMHSAGRSAYEFDAVAALLADRFKVVSWDMPGHGDSDRLPGYVSLRSFAAAALELADGFTSEPPLVGGGSVGAALALAAAELRPDGLAGVIPIELPLSRDTAWWTQNWAMVEQMFTLPDEPEDRMRARFRELGPELALRLRMDRHKAGSASMIQLLWAGRDDADATAPRIRALRAPALFINGDQGVAPDAAAQLPALNPNVRLRVVADAGHFPQTDDPAAVATAIAERFAR